MKTVDEILAALPGIRMILDIGCDCLSTSTPGYRRLFPKATIHCFEPDPRHAATIAADGTDKKLAVHYHQLAVADYTGARPFWQSTAGSQGGPMGGSLCTPRSLAFHEGESYHFETEPLMVDCTTIDAFCASQGIGAIDLLHLDVQGGENLVLRGARAMLPATRFIFAEHNTCGIYLEASTLDSLTQLLPEWRIVECWPFDVLLSNPAA